jgi:vesicle coat complex subunit
MALSLLLRSAELAGNIIDFPSLALRSTLFQFLVPDAPELIQGYLEGEQDPSCKRNAFIMLIHTDQQRALSYLQSCIDEIGTFGLFPLLLW